MLGRNLPAHFGESMNDNQAVETILGRLNDIARAVSHAASGSNLARILENIAQASADLVQARYAALGIPDGKGGLKYFKAVGFSADQLSVMGALPTGKGLLGAILNDRQTVRLVNMRDDPRAAGFCAHHPSMTSLLGVPILVGEQLFGSLYLCDKVDGHPFSEIDQWLVETLAGYAALAIAGAELAEHNSRLALLEERERLAMELHDGVIQSLYAIGMQLELARSSGEIQPDDLAKPIDELDKAIVDLRRTILNLKARDGHQKTVTQHFQEVIERLHIPESMVVNIDAPDILAPFTPGVFQGICLIIHEAASNSIRHSGATKLELSARLLEHEFEIVIADNGAGFDYEQARQGKGLGLQNIRQRTFLYGGRINVESRIGEGSTVTIHIPI